MDDAPPPAAPRGPDPSLAGRLSREDALAMLRDADALLARGDLRDAAMRYGRVVGVDDAGITAAGLLGLGEVRERLGDEDAAMGAWEAAVQLGETPSTYAAWRNIAAARVRRQDLLGAIAAYHEADRRAPAEDKAEIATRLGFLTRETGDARAARGYFARGRGAGPLVSATMVILAATIIVSVTALISAEGGQVIATLGLDKERVAAGEVWRLWTTTLVHGGPLHLVLNMYALYLVGPIAERWYGSIRFVLFYLASAAMGSVASFVLGAGAVSVGASGAIFGLLGLLAVAQWLHHPVDRQSRMFVSQLGMLILFNIAFGFVIPNIDNAAHLGGLVAGALLGALVPPTAVPTMSRLWQRPEEAGTRHTARVPIGVLVAALGLIAMVVVVGLVLGIDQRTA